MNEVKYDYVKNLKQLKHRYEYKMKNIDRIIQNNGTDNLIKEYHKGLLDGLETAINDIEDMLDKIEM